jgi:hypothetical protein
VFRYAGDPFWSWDSRIIKRGRASARADLGFPRAFPPMFGAMQQLRIAQASLNRDRDPYRSGGPVDMETWDNEGGAAATKVDWRRPLPFLFFLSRRGPIESEAARAAVLLSEFLRSWLPGLVGLGLLLFVLLVISGVFFPTGYPE